MILYSSDLEIEWSKVIEYYSLRFQIEFNFRDAKQYWGLEDFMVTQKDGVHDSANMAFWMVNYSECLLSNSNARSILDLKAHYHGLRYANEALKLLPKNTQEINRATVINRSDS